ncbi:hypothetical protein NLI96_g635 [Meripilus lineatus]|uniref:F-box domain-containing protein n=1 Tax=Meripilus lineatus TaxID=2056292 RepID=A0AAD5YNR9_9APHY|nr:hypothetical protein NLI96_g635 [Physisporinus lineatus]
MMEECDRDKRHWQGYRSQFALDTHVQQEDILVMRRALGSFFSPLKPVHPKAPTKSPLEIPPEIVVSVLQHLFSDNPEQTCSDFARVALVSKIWGHFGAEFLYRRVFLASPRQIRRFIRTIENRSSREHPVKEIILIDTKAEGSLLFHQSDESRQVAHVKLVKSQLIQLLHKCRNLHSFTVSLMYIERYVEILDLADGRDVIPNLRTLTTYHRSLEAILSIFAFPNLEHLRPCRHPFISELYIKPLPSVQTLQLYHPVRGWRRDIFDPDSLPGVFPNLQKLEYHKGEYTGPTVDYHVFANLNYIKDLYFVDFPELLERDALLKRTVFDSPKSITLGVIGFSNSGIAAWNMSACLEELTLLVATIRNPGEEMPTTGDYSPPKEILTCLEHNEGVLKSGTLRKLKLRLGPSPVLPELFKEGIDAISRLCQQYGISVQVDFINGAEWESLEDNPIGVDDRFILDLIPPLE